MGGGGGLTPDSYELARGGNWVGQTEPPVWRSENDSPRGNRGRGGSATPLPYRVTSMSKATAPEEQGALLTTAEAAAGAWPSLRPGRGHRDTRRARVRAGTGGEYGGVRPGRLTDRPAADSRRLEVFAVMGLPAT